MIPTLVIPGPPRTKKNSQRIFVNKRTGTRFVVPSKAAKDWNTRATDRLAARLDDVLLASNGRLASGAAVNCNAQIYRDRNSGDAVNYYQAIADALEDAGMVANDKQIVSWDGSRMHVDRKNPRVEITLTLV